MKAKLAVMSLGLFLLTGCSKLLVGKWTVDKNSPDLKSAKTIIKTAEFTDDGVFRADMIETQKDGSKKPAMKTGKYTFTGGELKLSTKEGDQVWWATLWWMRTLDLKRKGTGEKLRLKKVEQ